MAEMTQICPRCEKPMKHIGPWPDPFDGKIKETFVCEADCNPPPGGKFLTLRKAIPPAEETIQ